MSLFHSFLRTVTDTGDTASLMAIVIAGAIYLKCNGCKRAAIFLLASLAVSGMIIASLKLLVMGCHSRLSQWGIHSPSGHTADSLAVFGALAMLMRSRLERKRRALPLAFFSALVALIALSRVVLGYHSLAEVIVGAFSGGCALLLTRFLFLRKHGTGQFDAYALALWTLAAAFAIHGTRMPAEEIIRAIALFIRGHIPYCG